MAKYKSGEKAQVGDHVEFRAWPELWMKRRWGRLVYVPGISQPRADMEYNGLKWACIEFDGSQIAPLVHPESGVLKGIKLVKRSDDQLCVTPEEFRFLE